MTAKHYGHEDLASWVACLFRKLGVDGDRAGIAASVLIRANLRGTDTHGIIRIVDYVDKIRSGEINPAGHPIFQVHDGYMDADGDRALGQLVGALAVDEAVGRAASFPFVPCVIRRTGHLGALGNLTLRAAEKGMIAFMCQETARLMSIVGGNGPAIGNNPISFAIPRPAGSPIVLDMATSAVSRGTVLAAARAGSAIPPHWAIGPDGQPTSDAGEALRGALLPIAGHKGLGLAMMVQCLAASLTLSDADPQGANSSANVGAFLLVINPDLVAGGDAFHAHVDRWLSIFLNGLGAQGRYPGERAAECERTRLSGGIPIPDSVIEAVRRAGETASHPFDLTGN